MHVRMLLFCFVRGLPNASLFVLAGSKRGWRAPVFAMLGEFVSCKSRRRDRGSVLDYFGMYLLQ